MATVKSREGDDRVVGARGLGEHPEQSPVGGAAIGRALPDTHDDVERIHRVVEPELDGRLHKHLARRRGSTHISAPGWWVQLTPRSWSVNVRVDVTKLVGAVRK